MQYSHDVPFDAPGYNYALEQTVRHVRDHLAAVADPDDNPEGLRDQVAVELVRHDGFVRVTGTLEAKPRARYLEPGFDPDAPKRRGVAGTDEIGVIKAVCARMKQLLPSLTIEYLPGWESRGNGLSGSYVGGIVHHTASHSSSTNPFPTKNILINGRSDLPGPLCNFGTPWCTVQAPKIVVVAAFPANHAGASGGRSMGPLPVTTLFNPKVLGNEIDYYGADPMTDGQYLVATCWARAVADVLGGGSTEVVRAHMETSITGKWDPGNGTMGQTISMSTFRAKAKAFAAPEEDFLATLSDAEKKELMDAVGSINHTRKRNDGKTLVNGMEHARLASVFAERNNALLTAQNAALAALADLVARNETNDLTAEQVTTIVNDAVKNAVVQVSVDVTGPEPTPEPQPSA